jgi:hypothetical protein
VATTVVKQCHIVIYGRAGTGKTTALDYARKQIYKYLGRSALLAFAPSANAALLLQGFTLHRVFRKDARSPAKNYNRIKDDKAIDLKMAFKDVAALFGDEMSMMTSGDLYLMDLRLKQAFGNTEVRITLLLKRNDDLGFWGNTDFFSLR